MHVYHYLFDVETKNVSKVEWERRGLGVAKPCDGYQGSDYGENWLGLTKPSEWETACAVFHSITTHSLFTYTIQYSFID